jgi:hypothetical protein
MYTVNESNFVYRDRDKDYDNNLFWRIIRTRTRYFRFF